MYCKKCGKEIDDEAIICIHCGCSTENKFVEKAQTGKIVKDLFNNENFFKLIKSVTCICTSLYFLYRWSRDREIKYYAISLISGYILSIWVLFFIVGIIGLIEAIVGYKNKNRK